MASTFDGVVADFSGWFCKYANQKFGLSVDPSKQLEWNHQCLGISDAQVDEIWKEIRATPNFWYQKLLPLNGVDLLYDKRYQHDYTFITSRVETAGLPAWRQSAWWLQDYLKIKFPQVIVVTDTAQKVPIVKALNLHGFVDDKPATVRMMQNAGIAAYARTQPYNSACDDFPHVATVSEFITVMEERYGGGS